MHFDIIIQFLKTLKIIYTTCLDQRLFNLSLMISFVVYLPGLFEVVTAFISLIEMKKISALAFPYRD